MLALGHRLFQLDKGVREKQANYLLNRSARETIASPMFRMRDQTLGIVGFGKIGTYVGIKAKGLGMSVIANDPYVPEGVIESRGAKPVDFETLLRESDFISVNTALTSETKNMFSYEDFKKMKPTCYFINTARGPCIDQEALTRALREKLIAGAGIDVTVDEPLSKDNELLKMDNVILTGHSAGHSTVSQSELCIRPTTQIVKVIKGEWPPYAVNPEVRKKWFEKWGDKT
jgi:D-3-phosphoglycerate dehydrogenase